MLPSTNSKCATPIETGHRISEARRSRGWDHRDLLIAVSKLGRRYQFSRATLDNIENGRVCDPSPRTQFAIAHVLDLSVAELWPAGRGR